MSLLDEAMEPCVMLEHTTVQDSYGGDSQGWTDGATIQAAFAFNQSTAARVAAVQGAKDLYTIATRKDVTLKYHDVLRRERDGKVFRVTSDGEDHRTPASAALNMRSVTAEEWEVTNG